MKIYCANWIVPVESPPIAHGAIAVDQGRIVWLGPAADAPPGDTTDLSNVVLLPGLINAHTHLELTAFHNRIAPQQLWSWFEELLSFNKTTNFFQLGPDSVRRGAALSIESGVTCVADISRTGLNVAALQDSPIRKICFLELISGAIQLPNNSATLQEKLAQLLPLATANLLMLGISPHAPYTITPDDLAAATQLAAAHRLPITMHFLESREEAAWLGIPPYNTAESLAAFRNFLAARRLPTADLTPTGALALLERAGLLACSPLLAHVNYIDDSGLTRLASARAPVAFCPRAHAFFGHAPHRWRDMLAAGINVCLGTDSLACNDSLSILDELRFLHRQSPDVAPHQLLEMATIRSARTLGLADRIGSLAPGKLADFIAIPFDPIGPTDPIVNLIKAGRSPSAVYISGVDVTPQS